VSGERASHVLPNSTDPIDDTNDIKQLASDTISVCLSGSDPHRAIRGILRVMATTIPRAAMAIELGARRFGSAL
jgi:hypothetical protein